MFLTMGKASYPLYITFCHVSLSYPSLIHLLSFVYISLGSITAESFLPCSITDTVCLSMETIVCLLKSRTTLSRNENQTLLKRYRHRTLSDMSSLSLTMTAKNSPSDTPMSHEFFNISSIGSSGHCIAPLVKMQYIHTAQSVECTTFLFIWSFVYVVRLADSRHRRRMWHWLISRIIVFQNTRLEHDKEIGQCSVSGTFQSQYRTTLLLLWYLLRVVVDMKINILVGVLGLQCSSVHAGESWIVEEEWLGEEAICLGFAGDRSCDLHKRVWCINGFPDPR